MKLSFFALVLAACHAQTSAAPESCGPNVPPSAQHPVAIPPRTLAGDYDLIQVSTQPSPSDTVVGHLHLAPLDPASRARAVGGAVRDLVGWFDIQRGGASAHAEATSRDPEQPGAVLAGSHLRLGQEGFDAYVEHLTITAASPQGFWGWWKAEPGWEIARDTASGRALPDRAGYFCALRVSP